jgi:hypothetical protein
MIEIDDNLIIPSLSKPEKPLTSFDDIRSMVDFWSNSKHYLFFQGNDYYKTFAQQLANEIFIILAAENLNLQGVVIAFANREGWCDMDGSWGIKILEVSNLSFDRMDFVVEPQKS